MTHSLVLNHTPYTKIKEWFSLLDGLRTLHSRIQQEIGLRRVYGAIKNSNSNLHFEKHFASLGILILALHNFFSKKRTYFLYAHYLKLTIYDISIIVQVNFLVVHVISFQCAKLSLSKGFYHFRKISKPERGSICFRIKHFCQHY